MFGTAGEREKFIVSIESEIKVDLIPLLNDEKSNRFRYIFFIDDYT